MRDVGRSLHVGPRTYSLLHRALTILWMWQRKCKVQSKSIDIAKALPLALVPYTENHCDTSHFSDWLLTLGMAACSS